MMFEINTLPRYAGYAYRQHSNSLHLLYDLVVVAKRLYWARDIDRIKAAFRPLCDHWCEQQGLTQDERDTDFFEVYCYAPDHAGMLRWQHCEAWRKPLPQQANDWAGDCTLLMLGRGCLPFAVFFMRPLSWSPGGLVPVKGANGCLFHYIYSEGDPQVSVDRCYRHSLWQFATLPERFPSSWCALERYMREIV